MFISGKNYSKSQILRYVSNIRQLGGTRAYTLDEGRSRGVRVVDFDTGAGFRFSVVPDRGMDISKASYKGVNLAYLTPNGEVHPSYYEARGQGWLRSFFGGLLTTCGLTHFGSPVIDGDEELGLHGRYSSSPASYVSDLSRWEGDEYIIELAGTIEEAEFFGSYLRLHRTITTRIGAKSLVINDKVENFGYREAPFTILYHINPGFPLLCEDSELLLSSKEVSALQGYANIDSVYEFVSPQADWQEEDFHHVMGADEEGFSYAAMINPTIEEGLGLYITFDNAVLPFLNEWKMLGEGEYVTAIEPCNAPCRNRAELREMGMLPSLAPGETKDIKLEIGILDGASDISEFKNRLRTAK